MFRLKATLVATTLMRPWRTGWAVDRGVDFSLAETARPLNATPAARGAVVAAEPTCFIDEDGPASPGGALARSLARRAVEPPSGDAPETPGLRAWWSLASKPSRT